MNDAPEGLTTITITGADGGSVTVGVLPIQGESPTAQQSAQACAILGIDYVLSRANLIASGKRVQDLRAPIPKGPYHATCADVTVTEREAANILRHAWPLALVRSYPEPCLPLLEAIYRALNGERIDPQRMAEASGIVPNYLGRRRRRGQPKSNDLTVMSDPHAQAAIRGIYAASNGHSETWQQRGADAPMYQDKNGVLVYTRTADGGQLARSDDIASAWRQILALDDRHVSTFLIGLGKWFAATGGSDGSGMESARVSVDDVLSFRGVKKHHNGGYKPEQKREAREAMLALNNIWVRFTDQVYDQRGKRGRHKTVFVDSRLLEVSYESDTDLFGQELPYAFRVRPGEWAAPYLGESNRRTALLLRPIMQNDLRSATGRFAMRIGIYLTMQWRIRASRNNYAQPWTMQTLLDGACIPAETDARNYARFREYVEGALDKLQNDSVLRWEYVDASDDQLPKRGWFPEWLRWRVLVEPPAEITEQYHLMPARRAKGVAAAKAARKRAVAPAP